MHGPIIATKVIQSTKRFPGVCILGRAKQSDHGLFISYRRVGQDNDASELWEAIVNLHIHDPNSTFAGYIPFLIDTGTHLTIIPRALVPGAFPASKAIGASVSITGLTGRAISGYKFPVNLSITPHSARFTGIGFSDLPVLVVDYWEDDCAVLGLDVLRKMILVSDEDHVCLWPKL